MWFWSLCTSVSSAHIKTILQQTWAAYGCLAARSQVPCAQGLAAGYRLYAHSVCDVEHRCSYSCRFWSNISVIPLTFYLYYTTMCVYWCKAEYGFGVEMQPLSVRWGVDCNKLLSPCNFLYIVSSLCCSTALHTRRHHCRLHCSAHETRTVDPQCSLVPVVLCGSASRYVCLLTRYFNLSL